MMNEPNVRHWVAVNLAELLDLSPDDIKPDAEFASYGLDSADAIIIGGALEEQFDIEIDATLFLRNETIDALIADLRESGLLE